MSGRWVAVVGCAVAALAAAGPSGAAKPPVARVAACEALGAADGFAVFSGGEFTAVGTSTTGRIAAAGDVSLDSILVSPRSGDAPPTVVSGGDLNAGSGGGGTLNGGA